MRGWDGVGCMSQHGVGILIAGTGWCWEICLKIQWVGMGLGINCAGMGGDGENLVTPCRPLACIAHVSTMAPQELSTNAWKGTMAT